MKEGIRGRDIGPIETQLDWKETLIMQSCTMGLPAVANLQSASLSLSLSFTYPLQRGLDDSARSALDSVARHCLCLALAGVHLLPL